MSLSFFPFPFLYERVGPVFSIPSLLYREKDEEGDRRVKRNTTFLSSPTREPLLPVSKKPFRCAGANCLLAVFGSTESPFYTHNTINTVKGRIGAKVENSTFYGERESELSYSRSMSEREMSNEKDRKREREKGEARKRVGERGGREKERETSKRRERRERECR